MSATVMKRLSFVNYWVYLPNLHVHSGLESFMYIMGKIMLQSTCKMFDNNV